MSPEEFSKLEKESYLNSTAERNLLNKLSNKYVDEGVDGTSAWFKAVVEYDETYSEQLAYDIELNSRLAAERGRHLAVIAEAQENQNKFYSGFSKTKETEDVVKSN